MSWTDWGAACGVGRGEGAVCTGDRECGEGRLNGHHGGFGGCRGTACTQAVARL